MEKSPIFKVIAFLFIGVAGLDLLFGNTDKPLLPAFLGNLLTQQIDLVLIAASIVALVFL
jgi:hypothetical protein